MECFQHITGSLDDRFVTLGTEGVPGLMPRDSPDIDVFETGRNGGLPGLLKGRNRRRGKTLELEQGIESGEMDRCVRSQFSLHPKGHIFDHRHLIIFAGNQERRDFQVNTLLLQQL
jgi:hypothetical protein